MSTTCCTYIKPNGDPCAARPLPNSDFCLFHDPAHAQALAEARSQGGSTPRRRLPPALRCRGCTPSTPATAPPGTVPPPSCPRPTRPCCPPFPHLQPTAA